ncbi:hypothetical protein OC842_000512 [Tilletia horrida]|uniref:Major facilitator superfamily (MFS) profile domain-containing protein n=1 Tax=Tilletia horrida TaxID=155126 RepID=A0AAN6JPH7_9BASI|nr:hypothetical protein OC842_000512 [Tilletia horrida]
MATIRAAQDAPRGEERVELSAVRDDAAAAERRLIRKIDIAVGIPVFILFLLSYLDRSSLGNALTAGLTEIDGFPPNGANVATSVFFVTYVVFETPSAMFFQLIGVRRAISAITVAWGITTLCTGFVTSYAGLLAVRLVLGACESGFFPIFAIYLTFWYTRSELGLRTSYLFVAAAVSGAFGGLLAAAILNIPASTGRPSWAWLYFIEGGITVVAGVAAHFVLADDYESAWFLNEHERQLMRDRDARSEYQSRAGAPAHDASSREVDQKHSPSYNWQEARLAFKDPKTWISATAQFGADSCLFAFSTFLPSIIRTFDPSYSNVVVQLLTVPVYAFASMSYVATAVFTDRRGHRWAVMALSSIIIIVGFSILLATDTRSFGPRYFATFLTSMIYTIVGLNVSWLNMNNALSIKRSTASGIQLSMGNAGGILAGQIFRSTDAPAYVRGYATCLGLVGYSMTAYLVMAAVLASWNAARRVELERRVPEQRSPRQLSSERTTRHSNATPSPSTSLDAETPASLRLRRRWHWQLAIGTGVAFGEPLSFRYAL